MSPSFVKHPLPTQKGPRKRDAPYGNRNAFKYGFSSKTYVPAEMRSLDEDVEGQFADEIALARVNAAHIAELLMDYKHVPFEQAVAGSNALNHFLDSIQSLSRAFHYLYRRNGSTIEEAMEELANLLPEID